MGRRTLLMAASILVAALGTAMVWLYVRGADQRARLAVGAVPVLVVTREVPQGTAAGDLLPAVRRVLVPSEAVPDGALGGATALRDLGERTTDRLLPGGTVLSSVFFAAGPSPVPPGMSAASLPLEDPERVAGVLAPGSTVTVYRTDAGSGATGVLLEDVQVIMVGDRSLLDPDGDGGSGTAPQVVTFALTPDDARRLTEAAAAGDSFRLVVHGPPAAGRSGS